MKKVMCYKEMSKLPILAFSIISAKETLKPLYQIDEHWKYYNKNVVYLLELIGRYIENSNINPNNCYFIFEKKDNAEYERLKNYIPIILSNPKERKSRFLNFIDTNNFLFKTKNENSFLALADMVANAIYSLCNHINVYRVSEKRYFDEILNLFYYHKDCIIPYGLRGIHSIKDLPLLNEDKNYLLKINELRKKNE